MAASDSKDWLRGVDLNHRPLGYEPNELPDCSTPRKNHNNLLPARQTILGTHHVPKIGLPGKLTFCLPH
jgi:hypothetical protein